MDTVDKVYLPQALSLGVLRSEFWELSPRMLEPYQAAEKLRQKKKNMEDWRLGMYVKDAVASCFGNQQYPEEPYKTEELSDGEKMDRFSQWAEFANKQPIPED